MRVLAVLIVVLAAAVACGRAASSPPGVSSGQPDAAYAPALSPDAGAPATDGSSGAGAPASDGGSGAGIQLDAGWGSACGPALSAVPRTSSPTALLAAPPDPDWEYELPILRGHAIDLAWGASPDDVWAIADQPSWGIRTALAHWDGEGWSIGNRVGHRLHLLWGSGPRDVWAAGLDGFLHHFDGSRWTVTQVGMPIGHLAGTGPADVYLVLQDWSIPNSYLDVIRHYDGKAWTVLPSPSGKGHVFQLQAAGPDDLWAVVEGPWNYQFQFPEGGGLYHWDGRSWTEDRHWQYWGHFGTLSTGHGVWLTSPEHGMQSWDGKRWSDLAPPALGSRPQIFGLPEGEAWVLWEDGTVARTDGTCWQTVRTLGPLQQPYSTLEFRRSLFGGPGWVTVAESSGSVMSADRKGWMDRTAEPPLELAAMSGTSDDDLWAVGERGTILHRTSAGWKRVPSGTTLNLSSVWARAPNDVWVASEYDASLRSAVLLHFDGSSFRPPAPAPEPRGWVGVHPTSDGDVWLLGNYFQLDRWNGVTWSAVSEMRTTTMSTAFWPSGAADVWRAGLRYGYGPDHSSWTVPVLDHWDGASWTPTATARYITGFWGTSRTSIWAASSTGVLRWDGNAWSDFSSVPPSNPSSAIWASGDGDVWSVTRSGVEHWDGTAWRVFHVQAPIAMGQVNTVFGTAPGKVWVTGSAGLVARRKR